MSLIEKIKADREAGTPGPFVISFESIDPEWCVVTTAGGSIFANVHSAGNGETNARRIARVPEMEASLLAAEELAQALEAAAHNKGTNPDDVKRTAAALVAYREATA